MEWLKGIVTSTPFAAGSPTLDDAVIEKHSVQYLSLIAQKLRKTLATATPANSGTNLLTPANAVGGAAAGTSTNLDAVGSGVGTLTVEQTRQRKERRDTIVRCLRELVEILIWADNNDSSDCFDFFLEQKLHLLLLKILHVSVEDDIVLELLRFYNVFFESVQAGSILYFFLSNNHINDVIAFKYNTKNDEILSYYMTLLKNLSLKMNAKTANLFYNERADSSESLSEAWHHVDEAVDQLLYFQDLFALEVGDVAPALMDSLMEIVVTPLFLEGLLEGGASVQDTALFMLTHILTSITYIPILDLPPNPTFRLLDALQAPVQHVATACRPDWGDGVAGKKSTTPVRRKQLALSLIFATIRSPVSADLLREVDMCPASVFKAERLLVSSVLTSPLKTSL
ncbi:Protein CL16A [Rhizophlyctis rosea]|uniref:Protein CL16A n=1 Tax=Rhizophlyctis rosea TaxID=64517 RepID=A0AAD5X513_9FUNG|nr:Protein CL16A [Rhizophlyctis rosea]